MDPHNSAQNGNVQAFLRVIRFCEGTSGDNGYRMMFGGGLFDSFADHPRKVNTFKLSKGGTLSSSAAGAYQFLTKTWDGLVSQYGFTDFSPQNQDLGAIALIQGRKALDDVIAGRIEVAVRKCAKEWASLPGSPYGQPTKTMDQVLEAYRLAGGLLRPQGTPAPVEERKVLPFIAAALPALIQSAPALIRIFGDSPQAEKNAKAAEMVAAIAKEATGETTVEGAVNAIQTDPEKLAAYQAAVKQNMGEFMGFMLQAQEADEKSMNAAAERGVSLGKATGGKWLWLLGMVALVVVGMTYWITRDVLFGLHDFGADTKALLLGQVVILGFTTVLAFLFGSNIQSRLRDQQEKK